MSFILSLREKPLKSPLLVPEGVKESRAPRPSVGLESFPRVPLPQNLFQHLRNVGPKRQLR